jgi:anhydro-N-acetylmuramic acid kinase
MPLDLLQKLLTLRDLPFRRIVGLISGTSADGVDVAIIEAHGCGMATRMQLLAFETVPFEKALQQRILSLPEGNVAQLCEMNFLLGRAFAHATLEVAQHAGLAPQELHLIGSHGQTARHHPPNPGQAVPSTLQIGEGSLIAEWTGLPVFCDFRVADIAAGGQGAPLMPLAERLIFHQPQRVRALLNIGGIANITVLRDDPNEVMAFDIGPGNMALDAVAHSASRGSQAYDHSGQLAARGQIDAVLLAELLAHPYFSLRPPKSTGREMFGQHFVAPLIARYDDRLTDLAATLSQLTVEAIALAIAHFITPCSAVVEVLVSGGGVHNHDLMQRLSRRLAPIPVASIATLGVNPDAKEAIGFALLANEALFGHAGNLPSATGARGPRLLGKLVLPPLG